MTTFVEQLENKIVKDEPDTVRTLLSFWNPDVEECGFVIADGTVVRMDNVSDNPGKAWQMRVKDQIVVRDHYGQSIAAVWHTHPHNRETPSEIDEDGIKSLYHQGCPWDYLIVTEHGVFSYEYGC